MKERLSSAPLGIDYRAESMYLLKLRGEKQMTWVGLGGEAENVRHYAQFMAAFVRLKINLISAPH